MQFIPWLNKDEIKPLYILLAIEKFGTKYAAAKAMGIDEKWVGKIEKDPRYKHLISMYDTWEYEQEEPTGGYEVVESRAMAVGTLLPVGSRTCKS